MGEDAGKGLLLVALAAAGLLIAVAAEELGRQADRADVSSQAAQVAAWQVSQVLEDVRRITAEAAEQHAREVGP